jgi:hypothetical protein
MENKRILTNIEDKNGGKYNQYRPPYKTSNNNKNITVKKKNNINYIEEDNNNYVNEISEDKNQKIFKGFLNNFNQMNEYDTYVFPVSAKDNITSIEETNIYNNNNNKKNNSSKNKSIKNVNMKTNNLIDIKNIKNINLNTNIHPSSLSPNKSNPLYNENINEQYDSKYSLKMNKIKDDYIDFLQKEFEDNAKKSIKLDSNNKELLKKCDDLIHDNRILSNLLSERTTHLNNIIQENLTVKSELDKSLITNQKNEQKLEFYEEQFNLYKASNENYQKIIQELKDQIAQLNLNITQIQKTNEEDKEQAEKDYQNNLKIELDHNKKEIEDLYENKIKEEKEIHDQKIDEMLEHIKTLEEKNDELSNELNKKNNMFELVCKENEKLTGENNLFRKEVEQYSNQISEFNTIIKHKDNIISNLKLENLNNEKLLNKSSSCSMMKFDGSEYINENISKLITDNEENKMKIELLNNKIKNFDEIEKKYNEIMNANKTLSLSEKLSSQLNSNNTSPKNSTSITHFNYNNFNEIKNSTYQKNSTSGSNIRENYRSFVSPKKLELQGIEDSRPNSPKIIKTNNNNMVTLNDKNNTFNKYKNKGNTIVIPKNNIQNNKDKDKNVTYTNDHNIKKNIFNNNVIINKTKNKIDREIKVTKRTAQTNLKEEKDIKEISLSKKLETSPSPIAVRYYNKNSNKDAGVNENNKEIEKGKDETNKKKNFTYKPREIGVNLNNNEFEQKNGVPKITIIYPENEKEENIKETYYLYGIDRDDLFHVFDINNRKWSELKKITDIKDMSNTFKKDYQYEGTILYNTLTGLYILTGQKTDILYFYNSLTNTITKICKFNLGHDNGSLFLDNNSNCLFVFGGKNIKSCEYYSFNDKRIYKLPDLTTDRANASYIVSNNKIFAFFGFNYSRNTYCNSIEYIDYIRKDRWLELKNIQLLKNNISFDMESVSTMYYNNNPNLIMIYCGIQGDEEDFITEYYLIYDAQKNTMDRINKWNVQQYKSMGKNWKSYIFKKSDPKGFHFAKNSRFLKLPMNNNYDGYNYKDNIDVLIDYKNNVHFILQDKQKIDIYRNEL